MHVTIRHDVGDVTPVLRRLSALGVRRTEYFYLGNHVEVEHDGRQETLSAIHAILGPYRALGKG